MNRSSTSQRIVCLSLAALVTLGLGQALDMLAAREPSAALTARASVPAHAKAAPAETPARNAAKRG